MKKISLSSQFIGLLSAAVSLSLAACAGKQPRTDTSTSAPGNAVHGAEQKADEPSSGNPDKRNASKSEEPDPYGLMTCGHLNETRTMALKKVSEGGCELIYEKGRTSKKISWSSHSVQPCMNSRDKVLKELEAAGWKCLQD